MVALVPQEYARAGRIWKGELPLAEFDRLRDAVGRSDGSVHVDLQFEIDGSNRPHVFGTARTPARLPCRRCLVKLDCSFEANIDFVVVTSSREAEELFEETDAVVLESGAIELQTLVEDDLLLCVRSVACKDESKCRFKHRVANKKVEHDTHRPFAALDRLMAQKSGNE